MKKHLVFALLLTLLLVISGLVTIPFATQFDHSTQNIIYALGRIPIILGAALAFYGRNPQGDQA